VTSRARIGRIFGTIGLFSLVLWASAAWATPPRTPITVSLSISEVPRLYQPASLTIEVQSVLDAPGTVVELILPEGITAEQTRWTVDLKAGKPVIIMSTWSFVAEPGNVSLSVRANRVLGPGEVWGDMASIPLHLSAQDDRAVEGWRVDHVPVANLLKAGDALVVSTEPTPFSFNRESAPGASQVVPPGTEPALKPHPPASELSALGTVVLTGRLRYADRSNVVRDLDQQLLEIRKGDGTALSPRVYCYTQVDGTFSCPVPYTGTTLRVWARSYTSFSFGSGSSNRLGVFSGPEVSGGCGSDSVDCSYPVQTPAISCSDGQTCNVGEQYIALGEPWSGAHQMTQDLVRSWKKIWFDTRHPAGTASGPTRINYPVPAGHGTHAHVLGMVDVWLSIEPPNQQSADVVLHEYGHGVMGNLWAGFSPNWTSSDCPSPHYIDAVSGPGCALSEGFGNFWMWYSNQLYDGDNSTANDGPVFNWPGGASTNLETRSGYASGDQVEGNIAAALGDLLDSVNEGPSSGPGDRVTDGVQHIWHTVYTQSDSDFSQWWSAYWSTLDHEPCAALAVLQHNTIPYSVAQCSSATCYTLTRTHAGSGTDPVATPASSAGCAAGQYSAGQAIQLTSSPAGGWAVGSWTGTSNNSSTSLSNSLSMPTGNHTASVQYIVHPDIALANGAPANDSLAGSSSYDQWDYFYVDLGTGVNQLTVDLYNLTADADLFVRSGAKPDLGTFDCASGYGGTTNDQCVLTSPASGRWWIGVSNFSSGVINYTVRAAWNTGGDQGTSFYTLTPCRLLDTRSSSPLLSQVPRVVQVAGVCGVPSTAKAVAVNLTALTSTAGGYVTLWPGGPKPTTSTLNFQVGMNRANNAIMLLGGASSTLSTEAFVGDGGTVHLAIDVNGYFE
jgi:hypothetical protein